MANTDFECPELVNVLNGEQCGENFAGIGNFIYVGLKSDLDTTGLTMDGCTYKGFKLKDNAYLYKVDCEDEKNKITGSSLGYRGGFKMSGEWSANLVNKVTSLLGRAVNNLDIFIIAPDGDLWQFMYDKNRRVKFDADGITTDTGAATSDAREFALKPTLQPVKYPNIYVEEPTDKKFAEMVKPESAA